MTKPSTNYVGSRNVLQKCISRENTINAPQQTKPKYKENLHLDIDWMTEQPKKQNSNILINDDSLPISPIHNA